MNDELYHYGVLGMHWGVRKGYVSENYQAAQKKKTRLEKNVEKTKTKYQKAVAKAGTGKNQRYLKYQAKADTYHAKALKKSTGLFKNESKAAKLQLKGNKYQLKADKLKGNYSKATANVNKTKAKYAKAINRAERWTRAMNKEFSSKNLSKVESRYVNKGEKYFNKASNLKSAAFTQIYEEKAYSMNQKALDARSMNKRING